MKKWLLAAACVGLFSIGTVNTSAKEMSLKGNTSEYNNIYIVGNWVFQLNKYEINGLDVSDAASKYTQVTGERPAYVYYIVGGTVYEFDQKGSSATKPLGTVEEVFKDSKIFAAGLNNIEYNDLVFEDVEPAINSAISQLNTGAKEHGFEKITYENNTATFYISDPGKGLADYKNQVMSLIKSMLDEKYGFQSVTFNNETVKADEFKNNEEAKITELAVKVLNKMAGTEGLKTLNYASVANKSADAEVVYKDADGVEYHVTYTLSFVYDFEEEKDKVLTSASETLNDKIQQDVKSENPKYGFSEVTYDSSNHTLTFDIYDTKAQLSAFADSGIIDLFKKNYSGATHIEWTAGTSSEEFDLKGNEEDAQIKKFAAEVLIALAGGDSDLTVGSVANKSATATVTYADGTEVTYTLKFNYNVEEAKDYLLDTYSEVLKDKITGKGFSDITYDSTSNTVVFTNSGFDISLKDFATTGIVQLFQKWSDGATSVKYKVNDIETEYTETLSGDLDVMKLAARLLCRMAGKTEDECGDAKLAQTAIALKNGDVAGTSAVATFTFGDKELTYNLKFDYDLEKDTDETLTGYAEGLNEQGKLGDFKSVTYANKTLTYTFTNENESKKLTDYAGKEDIIEMFEQFIVGASEFEWTVGDVTKKYTVTVEEGEVKIKSTGETSAEMTTKALAAEILLAMSQNGSSQQAKDLTYKSVAGKEAKAKVTYKIGHVTETIEYILTFVEETAE